MRQTLKKYFWLGLCVAVMAWFGISRHHAEEERALRAAEAEAVRSVSVLPAGVEETWLRYIDKRISKEIQREGQNLKVRVSYIGAEPSYAYVSLNHPYQIDCNEHDLGFSISFGEGEESVGVILTGDISSDFKNEPERLVTPDSIASKNLDAKLCSYIANQLAVLMGHPTRP